MDVIKLDIAKQNEYSIKRVKKHSCNHKLIEVDVEEKEIRCQSCNTIVDSFDFIYGLATETENHVSHKQMLEREIKELQERKFRLEKDVNNLRAKERKEKVHAKDFINNLLEKQKWDGIVHYGNNGQYTVDVAWICEEYTKRVLGERKAE